MNEPNIKILLGYHKPSVLLKSEILTPIHVGRALATETSKDGQMNQEDYQWMLENMIGDDTGENISYLNHKYCELTALYWAWKNYDKLENPDYIGLMHYRRHFVLDESYMLENNKQIIQGCYVLDSYPKDYIKQIGLTDKNIKNKMSNCDVLAYQYQNLHTDLPSYMPKNLTPRTNYDWYEFLNVKDFDLAISIIKQKYPSYSDVVDEYINGNIMYGYNIFIMKKEIFFDYCQWLFDILQELNKQIDWTTKFDTLSIRVLGFISEQLYGIYVYNLRKSGKYKVEHARIDLIKDVAIQKSIYPAFKENNIPVIFSSDNNYAEYLGVCIKSLIANSSSYKNYDIFILDGGISSEHKTLINSMVQNNISIRYIDVHPYINQYSKEIFYIDLHFSIATYYRFFLPEIFANFDKILYLDCDTVILEDVAKLYDENIDNYWLAATRDIEVIRSMHKAYKYNYQYFMEFLKLQDYHNYFQAGCMVLNLKAMRANNITDKLIKALKEIKTPKYVDQCIMNVVCQGKVKFIKQNWNYTWHLPFVDKEFSSFIPEPYRTDYLEAYKKPYIIHFTGMNMKPWENPSLDNAKYFWNYARKTPFYEEILYKNLTSKNTTILNMNLVRDIGNALQNRYLYYIYKILSKITFGKKRKTYKNKKSQLKFKIRQVKQFLKGK